MGWLVMKVQFSALILATCYCVGCQIWFIWSLAVMSAVLATKGWHTVITSFILIFQNHVFIPLIFTGFGEKQLRNGIIKSLIKQWHSLSKGLVTNVFSQYLRVGTLIHITLTEKHLVPVVIPLSWLYAVKLTINTSTYLKD